MYYVLRGVPPRDEMPQKIVSFVFELTLSIKKLPCPFSSRTLPGKFLTVAMKKSLNTSPLIPCITLAKAQDKTVKAFWPAMPHWSHHRGWDVPVADDRNLQFTNVP